MNVKKVLPVVLLVIMAILAISIKRCKSNAGSPTPAKVGTIIARQTPATPQSQADKKAQPFDRTTTNLFYTKHAKCRMKCRHITQDEVQDILKNGTINYDKSNPNDPRGATYAVEGNTNDQQHVRIIFAPKTQHLTVVTVIDLEEEFACNCD